MTSGTALTRRPVLLAVAVLLLPRTARAQPSKRRRIATLSVATRASEEALWEAFRQGLHALGYGDEDIAIESRYADGHGERLAGLAAELARLSPEVIITRGSAAAQAAKEATATIPIVMANAGDPVRAGFVASFAHPGGNVTGLTTMQEDFAAKEMQLLQIVIPGAKRIAVLVNPGNPTHADFVNIEREAARSLGVTLIEVEVRGPDEIDGAFAAMTRERTDALVILGDAFFFAEASRIAGLAAGHKLPAIYDHSGFPAIGGLMSYGPDLMDNFRRAASYVDKILRGIKAADLPIEQPTKFELVINLKTAKALGLIVPQSLLQRADEVIE